eukprot:scpid78310/ scgid20419/ 
MLSAVVTGHRHTGAPSVLAKSRSCHAYSFLGSRSTDGCSEVSTAVNSDVNTCPRKQRLCPVKMGWLHKQHRFGSIDVVSIRWTLAGETTHSTMLVMELVCPQHLHHPLVNKASFTGE